MISMELPPSVHIQHMNQGGGHGGLSSLQSQHHHASLMQQQHQQHQSCLASMQDDKQKSELRSRVNAPSKLRREFCAFKIYIYIPKLSATKKKY